MVRLSYNISNEEKQEIFLCHEATSGEHIVELREEEYNEVVQDPPVPLKLNEEGKIIVDTSRLRIAEIYQELESTNWVVNEIMEYMINEQEVPQELIDIRDSRNVLKEELSELE
ncbi:hypothetical protein MARBORIA2_15090 [Methanobrevibacter arboriphilus]|jgi:hypothetical protein|uniref:hypothetical protein n=1 Tax=Methanobrevibacter arboriphilus TaxID=39441 RepID=UPI0022EE15AB|nr:hypothetical protein [Methanobrevibacter arboriphilus]GLI12419.1 hypothetical protein MARBORIA2_15090 [Methanobrevibacter arboriphilus]